VEIVNPARAASAISTVVLACALSLAGCAGSAGDGDPVVEPAAVGTVRSVEVGTDSVAVGFDPDAGFEYFEGTTFVIEPQTPGVDASTLEVGDRVEVWTEVCAESFPVQCSVQRIELADT
jgi:hypothetical protein